MQMGFLCGEGYGHGRWLLQPPARTGSSLRPPALLSPKPPRRMHLGRVRPLLPPESPGQSRGGHGGWRRGAWRGEEEEEGAGGGERGWWAGWSNFVFVSSVSAHEGACVVVGVASPRGVCVCWQRCQCVSLRGSGSPWPPPPFVFWGPWLWARPAVLRADAADVAGPQLCLLPGEGGGEGGEGGSAICSPGNSC